MATFRERIKQQKDDMVRQQQKDAEESARLGQFGSIIVKDKVPQGILEWRPGGGSHLIDVIPFYTGPDFPEGENLLRWCLRVWDHTRIGAMNDAWTCVAHMFKQRCAIEDYLTKNRLPEQEWNKIKAKLRNIVLVWVRTTPDEEAKGVRWWYIAHFFFGAKIDKISRNPKGGGIIDFWDPDNGKSIAFDLEIKSDDNQEWSGHRFVDRDGPIPDNILNQSFALDSIVNWRPSYADVYESFHGAKYVEGESTTTAPDRLKKPEDKPKETPIEESASSVEESAPPAEEAKAPVEETTTTTTETTTSSPGGCPKGHQFGVDCDKKPDCNGCPSWDDCSDEMDRVSKSSAPAQQQSTGRRLLA